MRVLFLTHRLPYAPNRGDRIRSYYLLREMSRFATVSLFSFVHDDEEAAQTASVPASGDVVAVRVSPVRNSMRGALLLPTARPLTHSLLDAPDATRRVVELARRVNPDVVVSYCSGMARFSVGGPLRDFPLILDMVDVDSQKWDQYADTSRPPKRWIYQREAMTLSRFEALAAQQAHCTLVTTDRERQDLLRIAPGARVEALPNGIDIEQFAPQVPPTAEPVVVFSGMMDYFPNVQGVQWFAQHVWPLVRAARGDARWLIVGANPVPEVQRLAEDPSITVTGRVDAIPPFLWQAAVAVAPLHVARGLQNKVLEAIAAGLPVVATPAVVEGIPRELHTVCRSASSPEEFAGAVLHALDLTPARRQALMRSAPLDTMSWGRRLSSIEPLMREAAASAPALP